MILKRNTYKLAATVKSKFSMFPQRTTGKYTHARSVPMTTTLKQPDLEFRMSLGARDIVSVTHRRHLTQAGQEDLTR
jgi:hypothetical protein